MTWGADGRATNPGGRREVAGAVVPPKAPPEAGLGDDETPLEQRGVDLVKVMWKCEPHPESPFSVYLVHTDEDFQRVVIGMNGSSTSVDARRTKCCH
jgi:hypothetical protein